jgi:ubiquinone/menaquinone biosynthesis C-methylase UbiE
MIHPAAATGFARGADAYERARPDYPPEAISWLAAELDLGPGRVVVDLAAGTGKLTRPLAALGCEVVAIEPVAAMRARIGAGVRALAGTAEAMPLPDSSADAVTVGQAFHWFDAPAALAEIERVLRPGGALALVWSSRPVETSPLHRAIEAIVAPYRHGAPVHAGGAWRAGFAGRELVERRFPFSQQRDADALADRVGSTSVIAALPDAERSAVLERVRALAPDGPVALPYVCEVYVWRPG